jgi:putative MATE family efflux protein
MSGKPPQGARFTTGSILRHVATMSATGTIGLVAIFAVDLVNLFYISLLGVSEMAAAVGFAGTILFLQTSLCIGVSIGIGATVARAIGAGNRDGARRLAGTGLLAITAVAALVGLLVLPFLDSLLGALGATGRTRSLAAGYLLLISPTLPLVGLAMGLSALLRAVGDARRSMNVTLAGGLATLVLDPILILWFDMGLTGAAIAAILSRIVLVAVGWHGAARVHGIVAAPVAQRLAADARALMAVAGPAVLTNLATPIASTYVTASLARFGDAAVAGQATVDRIMPVAFGALFALTGAVGPVFAQNLGAGRMDRVAETLRTSLVLVLGYVLLAWAALYLGQDLLVRAFSAQGIGEELLRLFCTVVAGSCLFLGCLFVANAAFNNLGNPWLSTFFNWGRATLGTIPLAALGAQLGGAPGVLMGQAAGTTLFGLAALAVAFRVVRRLARDPAARPDSRTTSYWRPPTGPAASAKASIATAIASEVSSGKDDIAAE